MQDAPTADAAPPLVALRGVSKRWGERVALDAVDLTIAAGEVRTLLGETGAGKSTLVGILSGAVEPSAGEILWEGRRVDLPSPAAARALGVGATLARPALFDAMTVVENVAAATPGRGLARTRRAIAEASRAYGLPIDPDRPARGLAAGERLRVELLRCVVGGARLIVLDEPTAALAPQEARRLFETLERLAAEGVAILHATRRIEEARRLGRPATILREGRVVATLDPGETPPREIAALTGAVEAGELRGRLTKGARDELLRVERLSLPPEAPGGEALREIELAVRSGEILGLAGLPGEGQGALFAALSGERLARNPGDVVLGGVGVGRLGIDARRRLGAAFAPGERLGRAVAPDARLSANALLTHHATSGLVRSGVVAAAAAARLARSILAHLDVRAAEPDPPARALSESDLQCFLVGREILRGPKVLVVEDPTLGVEPAAARRLRRALVDLAAKGAAVVAIGRDVDELLEIADRVAVMREGRLGRPRPAADWTREEVGLEMTGGGRADVEAELADAP